MLHFMMIRDVCLNVDVIYLVVFVLRMVVVRVWVSKKLEKRPVNGTKSMVPKTALWIADEIND